MKILVVGNNLPAFEGQSKLEAAHYRTWQLTQPLLDDGHSVLLTVPASSRQPQPADMPPNLQWRAVRFGELGWPRQLQEIHDSAQPDCIVGVDFYPSLWATKLRTEVPMWLDLYGDPLTIMQVGQFRGHTDQGRLTHLNLLRCILGRGDVFSTCGMPQKHMLVGELALYGRLTYTAFGYEFVHPIYPGASPVRRADPAARSTTRDRLGIPEDAFVVVWSGGYNTWTDTSTLFKALDDAMSRNRNVHFVSAGASTYGGAETAYSRLESDIASSEFRDRYHLLGWRPWNEIPDVYLAADAGISIDALHYETIYGTRTRLVEMLSYGLPVFTSEGAELSTLLPRWRCGVSFPTGDWQTLGNEIIALAEDEDLLQRMSSAAEQVAQGPLSFAETTTPLRKWVSHPQPAPDRSASANTPLQATRFRLRSEARKLLWHFGLDGRRP